MHKRKQLRELAEMNGSEKIKNKKRIMKNSKVHVFKKIKIKILN
jgi:hypothetical protein